MIIRILTRSVRGPAKPRQIFAATVLGSMVAFVPSYTDQAFFAIGLVALLFGSGANIPLASAVWFPARLLALAVMPFSFSTGKFLIDGPAHDLIAWFVNAPVFALFGFQYFALTGGIPVAIAFGGIMGALTLWLVRVTRKKLNQYAEGESGWKKVLASPYARGLNWIFGGDWKKPEPVSITRAMFRPLLGVAFLAVVYLVIQFAPGPWLKPVLADQLAEWNGATVDLEDVEVNLARGRLTLVGLEMADDKDLDRNLFSAGRLEADFSTGDFLRGRWSIDRAVAHDSHQGTLRETRGVRVEEPEQEESDSTGGVPTVGDGKTLDDYLEEARVWEERLEQVKEWLEKIAGSDEEGEPESTRERMEREIAELGWGLVASHELREDAPALFIAEFAIEGMESENVEGDPIDVEIRNFSTDPSLVAVSPSVSVRSRSGRIQFDVGLGSSSSSGQADGTTSGLNFVWNEIATEKLLDELKASERPIVENGAIDLKLLGEWGGGKVGELAMPLLVTIREANWRLGGDDAFHLQAVSFPLELSGSLASPSIDFDAEHFRQTVIEAGRAELSGRLQSAAKSEFDELLNKGEDALGVELGTEVKDSAKGILDSILGDN